MKTNNHPGSYKVEFTPNGLEIPDPTPLDIPAGFRKPETLTETIKRLIQNDLSRIADEQGHETLEEASDFDIEEDDAELRSTRYEEMGDDIPASQRNIREPGVRTGLESPTNQEEQQSAVRGKPTTNVPSKSRSDGKLHAKQGKKRIQEENNEEESDVD